MTTKLENITLTKKILSSEKVINLLGYTTQLPVFLGTLV